MNWGLHKSVASSFDFLSNWMKYHNFLVDICYQVSALLGVRILFTILRDLVEKVAGPSGFSFQFLNFRFRTLSETEPFSFH